LVKKSRSCHLHPAPEVLLFAAGLSSALSDKESKPPLPLVGDVQPGVEMGESAMSFNYLARIVKVSGLAATAIAAATMGTSAQGPATRSAAEVTFTRDIAPILQRSCQGCHNPDGGAPMSLTTYEEVRPYARAIKTRTGMGPRAGVMPPWFVEKNIGIQRYKGDPSLSEEEIAKVAKWADSGAPPCRPRRR
jgi:mono/diheme cytochrome c family protein